jgi:hypothetical protein
MDEMDERFGDMYFDIQGKASPFFDTDGNEYQRVRLN